MKLILSSGSPRRAEILMQGGFSFCKRLSDTDETLPDGISPAEAVKILAQRKGDAIPRAEDEVVLAADTVVALDGKILGKPKDRTDAKQMLLSLSGHTHSVFTGVYVGSKAQKTVFHSETLVTFYPLTEKEIDDYIKTGEPDDKAGAYGIQGRGALFVEKIDGDYLNVVGLPLARTAQVLKEFLNT